MKWPGIMLNSNMARIKLYSNTAGNKAELLGIKMYSNTAQNKAGVRIV